MPTNTLERPLTPLADYVNPPVLPVETSNTKTPESLLDSQVVHGVGETAANGALGHPEISSSENNVAEYFKNTKNFNDYLEKSSLDPMTASELRAKPLDEIIRIFVDAGLVSQQIIDNYLDIFEPDTIRNRGVSPDSRVEGPVYCGGLRHILIGDAAKGLHDVDTLDDLSELGILSHPTDTRLVRTDQGETTRGQLDTPYELQPDLRMGIAIDTDRDGVIDTTSFVNLNARSQFPEDWTMDDIITQIADTAKTDGRDRGPSSDNTLHCTPFSAVVDGRMASGYLVVHVKKSSGKVTSAYPVYTFTSQLETQEDKELVGAI